MAKFPFVNGDGRIFYYDTEKVVSGRQDYIVIKRDEEILCFWDESGQVYTLPAEADVELNTSPSGEFSIIAYVIRGNKPIKEQQRYKVYEVGKVDLADLPLEWVALQDILLTNVAFDATQKSGMKNLLVRRK